MSKPHIGRIYQSVVKGSFALAYRVKCEAEFERNLTYDIRTLTSCYSYLILRNGLSFATRQVCVIITIVLHTLTIINASTNGNISISMR